jgi:hypothetical protein
MSKSRRYRRTPPLPHSKPHRVRWQDFRGWVERQLGGKTRRPPPVEHRDFETAHEAEAFAEQLRASRGPECLTAVLYLPILERPIQPALTDPEPLWPPQVRRMTP